MTKMKLMIAAAILVSGLAACNNAAKDESKQDVTSLTQYVDSVEMLKPVYTSENWAIIDEGYQQRALKAESKLAELDAEDKAKAEQSKAKYAALKATYEIKIKEMLTPAKTETPTSNYRQVLRNRLFGEGKIGDDMKFEFVTGANILSVYKNFVNTVADNKNNYTREDWDEIKVLYEALDTRKNAVEKDLSSGDNLKIAGLKIRFASIKATHRAATKGAENEKAKD